MISGDPRELEEIVKENKCPIHSNPLTVAWNVDENDYVIRCGDGHFPDTIENLVSITQAKKIGVVDLVQGDLRLLPKADLGTGEFLTAADLINLVAYANRYGLDAYRGHVVLMYGEPYIGLDGYLYHANREGIAYQLRSRPLNDDERKAYRITEEKDHAWIAEVTKDDGSYFSGQGIVPLEEMTAKSKKDTSKLRSPVVAAHPWQLAQKRAEWQGMRRAFPIGEDDKKEEG